MKSILKYLSLYLLASSALADTIVLNNETNYPEKNKPGKIAVQWAESVEATQKANKIIINGTLLDSGSLKMLPQKGKIHLTSPGQTRYFRIVVWSANNDTPDLLTNWVDIIPNKTYLINQDQLVPARLISGAGC